MKKLMFALLIGSGVGVVLLNLPAVGAGDTLALLFGGGALVCGAAVATLIRFLIPED